MTLNPHDIFRQWFIEASQHEPHHTAFVLSTATVAAHPSSRAMLLKHHDERGFVFYTNLKSRKALELACNPCAAMCFYWHNINKQIRIEGKVEAVASKEADEYFQSRPRDSQISSWASQQSQPMMSQDAFTNRIKEFEEKFAAYEKIPRPDFWSGFRLIPEKIEFWEDRSARRHERLLFYRHEKNVWVSERLFP